MCLLQLYSDCFKNLIFLAIKTKSIINCVFPNCVKLNIPDTYTPLWTSYKAKTPTQKQDAIKLWLLHKKIYLKNNYNSITKRKHSYEEHLWKIKQQF